MTVESNYAIAIATLNDWLTRLAPVFQPILKPIAPCTYTRDFSWFWFFDSHLKTALR